MKAIISRFYNHNIGLNIYYGVDYIEIEYKFKNHETSIHRVDDLEELIEDMEEVFFEETGIEL